MLLEGIFPAITTPFYPDGAVYYRKLEHNVDRYSKTPAAGMVVLGSTGEAVSLSDAEQREILRVAIEHAYPEKVMVAGTGQESTRLTLELSEYAAKLGYDVVLVRTPSYYRPQLQDNLSTQLTHYRYIADRCALPVLLYSVPPFTAYDLPVEAVKELCEHPNIVGIKESSGNVEKIAELKSATAHVKRTVNVTEVFAAVTGRMLRSQSARGGSGAASNGMITAEALAAGSGPSSSKPATANGGGTTTASVAAPPAAQSFKMRNKTVGFQILAGAASRLLPSLQAGASGAVLAFAAPAPTACYEVFAAWKEGDTELAQIKQERIMAAAKRCAELGVPGLKHALDLNGYFGGFARLPLLPLTAEQRSGLEQLMSDLRN